MTTTITAPTFTFICECFRCAGFKRAFSTFRGVNDGRCLRCNGTLRDLVTKPTHRMDEYLPAGERRTTAIATIAKVLSMVGADAKRDEKGARMSEWGFTYARKNDDCLIFAAALTTSPDDVRRRGWVAFCAKARAKFPADRAEKLIAATRTRVVAFSGLTSETVGAWLGESVANATVAA